MKIKNYSDGQSPAIDIGLSVLEALNGYPNDEVSKKTLHIEIIERNSYVDFAIIDQSEPISIIFILCIFCLRFFL